MSNKGMHMFSGHFLEVAFRQRLAEKAFWKSRDRLFLACSGGVDSMVLAHLLHACGQSFQLLHCNFNLRGEESKRDEVFVRDFAAERGIPIQIESFDTTEAMKTWGMGLQETARKLRYDWFRTVVSKSSSPGVKAYVLTAHHADDLAETLLINFLRGTGIAGLHGIPEKNECFIRPLLFARKHELLAYAREMDIKWVEDRSNAGADYTRNRIRLQVMPALEQIFPSVGSNLIGNAKRFSEIEILYRKQIEKTKTRLLKKQNGVYSIPVNLLKHAVPLDAIMYELFADFGFGAAQAPEIKKLLDAPTGKWMCSETHRVLKNRNWLLIEKLIDQPAGIIIIEKDTTEIPVRDFDLKFTHVQGPVSADSDPGHAWLDAKQVTYPLILRKWKEGDYFYPLGMKKKKKVSRFLTDLKLSKFEKENQWILSSNNRIMWVVGRRIDERFKLQPMTGETLLVRCLSKNMADEGLKQVNASQ